MDTTFGKSADNACRCCGKSFSDDDLQSESLFEYTNEEMEVFKILMLLAPISISRNDGFSQKICVECKSQAVNAYHFRLMIVSTDENIRSNRKPLTMNNEHDYSTWNINDYDMDLSEYLIDEKQETIQNTLEPELPNPPAIEEIHNFVAPKSPKKMPRYSCPICDKRWVTPSKLKRHMSVHRNEIQTKEAPKVEVKRSSISTLTFFEPPKKEPEVQCPICFLAIESQSALGQHMNTHVKNAKPEPLPVALKIGARYICVVCGSESPSPAKLNSHMKAKHMPKNTDFRRRLNSHTCQERKQQNRCTFCSKFFQNLSSLKRHISAHVRIKQTMRRQRPRRHACQHCEKRFETPSKLQRHQSVHRDILQGMKRHAIESSPVLEISAVTSILGD